MRKELLIAIVVGLLFGLIIGFGIWRANSAINKDQISTESTSNYDEKTTDTKIQEPTQTESKDLVVSAPLEYDVLTQNPVVITGLTTGNTNVIISTEVKDYIVTSKPGGDFTAEVQLSPGLNQILITNPENTAEPKILNLVYSEELK
ncbi:MAG: hypothetical protein US62_C0017G0014 [Candidatus Woesebacteria bacterium GW2011_GWA1_37_8]|uniref:Uncharacterized protein n=2 Tax=Candidatus Woeseibacteriota TaxID=1752722 RepID=A0A0G0PCX2_9BACT|nr:MAG: hypothetical protein US39_C0003G0062 [Microgenomates group bacterium GW2011_GWC1_37_12b]KKQ45295.1 MAG: hypothetical protein US62_C0017G0014 [Candidatus Woesebacteria bacterium GW2011_GWA1_37_8]KKQ87096.1 MAG: hypothetical protein UT10_C0011G0027 [Candidatus Woesebacteria bacterium GW2011_GWB1_38_8b]